VCSHLMGITDKYFNNLKARAHTRFKYSARDSKYYGFCFLIEAIILKTIPHFEDSLCFAQDSK
jgi:hypothetical protein